MAEMRGYSGNGEIETDIFLKTIFTGGVVFGILLSADEERTAVSPEQGRKGTKEQ